MKELALIEMIKNKLPDSNAFIGDDTAFLEELGLVVTTDTLVEEVHFRLKNTTPFELGFKSMAVNLSDIASDGAIPAYALVSLSLPSYIDENFVDKFYDGMKELCVRHGVKIIGGDITSSEKLFINITLIGKTNGLKPARRTNAKVGQLVIATGFYGTSKAGFEILENREKFESEFPDFILKKFFKAHNTPEPHLGFGRIILQNCKETPAMMDTSDGLADALFKIAQASKVELEIDASLIPMVPDLGEIADIMSANPLEWALFGGEDYTLIATVDEEAANKLAVDNIPIRKIGKVVAKHEEGIVKIKMAENQLGKANSLVINQKILEDKGFKHFD